MRLAIISDVHSNLPALEAVLDSAYREGCQNVVCLGDVVGYGASPIQCLDLLEEKGIPVILGNHDAAAAGRLSLDYLNEHARTAIEWTIHEIGPARRERLARLPATLEREGMLFVHASPFEPLNWHYIFNQSEARVAFREFVQPVCFVGHTHFPVSFQNPSDGRRLINVGSVGQPRDRDNRACYGIFDTTTATFRWERVEYDIGTAVRAIIQAELPRYLADRLRMGV